MRAVLVVLFLLFAATGSAQAQTSTATPTTTATPTATSTPVMTPSSTPELSVMWTLQPPASTGTPMPGQDVVMVYTINIDHVLTAVLMFTILVILWGGFVLAVVRGWL